MIDTEKYKHEFKLPRGFVVKIGGIPYSHLGRGVFGGNTMPELAGMRVVEPPVVAEAQAHDADRAVVIKHVSDDSYAGWADPPDWPERAREALRS